jgi:hypothetical protein
MRILALWSSFDGGEETGGDPLFLGFFFLKLVRCEQ